MSLFESLHTGQIRKKNSDIRVDQIYKPINVHINLPTKYKLIDNIRCST